jgi:hypothetical protein
VRFDFDGDWQSIAVPLDSFTRIAEEEGQEAPSEASIEAAKQVVAFAIMESLFRSRKRQIEIAGADHGGVYAIFLSPDLDEEATIYIGKSGEIKECVYVSANFVASKLSVEDPKELAKAIVGKLYR